MPRLLPALLLLALAGCNVFGYRPAWVASEYPDVRFDDAFDVVQEAIDRDYDLNRVERENGLIETKWSDSSLSTFERRSTRAKVHAEVTGGRGKPVDVKIRVERESSKVSSVFREHESDDDWESYPDDPDEAQRLTTRIQLVLHEFGASPALKQRIQRAQDHERRRP
ncbi:MAG: hypothetical protein U1E76_03170 [Planctomycetota bacterium]